MNVKRETISSLNHPNICTLFDVGSQDGIEFLVMEYVEGETLGARLGKGPLPLDQSLKYGAQVADALDKAHRGGVVHRDLKPGNIMLTSNGAKLLDFGLAKPAVGLANGLTVTAAVADPMTQEGMIVGTFQYMSPEQIEGKEVDGRSDIFSFGAVLYEMLTGHRAFEGKSQLSVASAILEKDPPPLNSSRTVTPPVLDRTVKKCLAKNPDERWQSASDLASELQWIADKGQETSAVESSAEASRIPAKAAWVAACAAVLLLAAAMIWWRGAKSSELPMQFYAAWPVSARDIAVAPNGHTVAVAAYSESAQKTAIWIYELGSAGANILPGTEGATYPFWSPRVAPSPTAACSAIRTTAILMDLRSTDADGFGPLPAMASIFGLPSENGWALSLFHKRSRIAALAASTEVGCSWRRQNCCWRLTWLADETSGRTAKVQDVSGTAAASRSNAKSSGNGLCGHSAMLAKGTRQGRFQRLPLLQMGRSQPAQ